MAILRKRKKNKKVKTGYSSKQPKENFEVNVSKLVNYMDRRSYEEMKVDAIASKLGFYTARKTIDALISGGEYDRRFDFNMDGEVTAEDTDVMYYYRDDFQNVIVNGVLTTTSSNYHFRITAFDTVTVDGEALEKLVEPDTQEVYVIIPQAGEHQINVVMKEILEGAFKNETCLISAVISGKLEAITKDSFVGCTKLTSLRLPSDVASTVIENGSFTSDSALKTINVPYPVNKIENGAFSPCVNVETVTWGSLLNPSALSQYCRSKLKKVTIESTVSKILSNAFEECVAITGMTFPSSVNTIESNAFSGCSGMKTLTIPSTVTSIADNAFSGCTGIGKLSWNTNYGSLSSITESCNGTLSSVTIGSSVSSLKAKSFSGCTKLSGLTLSPNLKTIGDNAFNGCTALSAINLSYITSFGKSSFAGCTKLSAVTLAAGVTLGESTFNGCTGITSLTVGTISTIGSGAFNGCSGVKKLTWGTNASPSCVTQYCGSNLETVTISTSNITTIGVNAFAGCTKLSTLNLPTNISKINEGAFDGCTALETLYVRRTTPPTLSATIPDGTAIKVPSSYVNTYKNNQYWSAYADRISAI